MPTLTSEQEQIKNLEARVEALERSQPGDNLAIGVMSGNLDTTMAAFIIALGATAYDMQVDMFSRFGRRRRSAIRKRRRARACSTACSAACFRAVPAACRCQNSRWRASVRK